MRFERRSPKIRQKGNEALPPGCPACGEQWRTVQFDWKTALAQPNGEWGSYPRTLLKRKDLKKGSLYQCVVCNQPWYLDPTGERMMVIPEDKLPILKQWDDTPLVLESRLWEKLRAIGATASHHYSKTRDYAEVPCTVITRKGQTFLKSLVCFSTQPPFSASLGEMRLSGEIEDIRPCDRALPAMVRNATALSTEGKPGYALTPVEAPKDKLFYLNWTANFFDQKGVKGKDVVLSSDDSRHRTGKIPVINEDLENVTFFLADWTELIREIIPYPPKN